MTRIVIETSQINRIPVLMAAPEGAQRLPLVFFLHGFTAGPLQGLRTAYRLAEAGMVCVCPTAPHHGLRHMANTLPPWERHPQDVYPEDSGLDVFYRLHQIVQAYAQEVEGLAQALMDDPRVNTQRMGVTGFSMGGWTSYYLAAHSGLVAAAAPMSGIPLFAERWADVVLESSAYPQWQAQMQAAEANSTQIAGFMTAIDPAGHLPDFAPRPLCILHGDRDCDAPKRYAVQAYRQLLPAYASRPENLRLAIIDGVGHELPDSMVDLAVDWFHQHLVRSPAATLP